MEKLIVLGTGNAMVTKCYNTCFALQNEAGELLLVDAGGGNGILRQYGQSGLDFANTRHMIVTHEHCDHLLGVVWVLRKVATLMEAGKYTGDFHIWCHAALPDKIRTLAEMTLQKKFVKLIGVRIIIHVVADRETQPLLGWEVTFFDIHSTKAPQFGFYLTLHDGRKLTCLGDEPYNPACGDVLAGTDILLCEAFCLYSEAERFHPYEKHHSTVKEACALAEQAGVKTLVLWHTEDANYEHRKALYTAEGQHYFTGELLVPYDLEVIPLGLA